MPSAAQRPARKLSLRHTQDQRRSLTPRQVLNIKQKLAVVGPSIIPYLADYYKIGRPLLYSISRLEAYSDVPSPHDEVLLPPQNNPLVRQILDLARERKGPTAIVNTLTRRLGYAPNVIAVRNVLRCYSYQRG